MLEGLRAALSFLTILPVRSQDTLGAAARAMPLFPVVGLLVGGLAGSFGLFFFLLFPPLVAGVLTLGALLALTGLHHTDGLLDFGDGLMRNGTREQKLAAMRDTNTGAGAFGLAFIVLAATAAAISSLQGLGPLLALASAETTAKASMVLAARLGVSAAPGSNVLFIEAMHGRASTMLTAACILLAALVGLAALGLVGLAASVSGLLSALLVSRLSTRQFGGLTGDVFGATNEITRMVSLIVMVVR